MADLRKKVLGTVSGSVGDILFRVRNGKNYLGTKPLSFMPGTDENSIQRRKRFAMATRLAKPINSIYPLKSLWKQAAPSPLSSFNMIVRTNYNSVQSDAISDTVNVVPDIGFSIRFSSIAIDENHFRISIDAITSGSGINPAVELNFQLAGILHLSNPLDPTQEGHRFLQLLSDEQTVVLNTELNFEIVFQDKLSQLVAMYQDRKVFLTLLTLNVDNQVVNYSNTFFNT